MELFWNYPENILPSKIQSDTHKYLLKRERAQKSKTLHSTSYKEGNIPT